MTKLMRGLLPFLHRYALVIFVIVGLLLLASSFIVGRWSVYRAHPELASEDQATAILERVGKLIVLPSDETPQMATIKDAASAKVEQPFLKDAENGDVLIVYSDTGEAILYRPSTEKLIAVGPVTDDSSEEGTTPKPSATRPPIEASTTHDTASST
jgi:hypothetical protein